MADEQYTVKINRRDGVVEITGSDKEWIAEQIEALRVVYEQQPDELTPQTPPPDEDPPPPAQQTPADPSGKPTGTRTRRGRSAFRGTRNKELADKLNSDVRAKLVAWMEEREGGINDAPDRAAVVVGFLEDVVDWDGISADDLYTVSDVMGWPAPNPKSALHNGKVRKNYFTIAAKGKYRLTHGGQQFARHEAKVAATETATS